MLLRELISVWWMVPFSCLVLISVIFTDGAESHCFTVSSFTSFIKNSTEHKDQSWYCKDQQGNSPTTTDSLQCSVLVGHPGSWHLCGRNLKHITYCRPRTHPHSNIIPQWQRLMGQRQVRPMVEPSWILFQRVTRMLDRIGLVRDGAAISERRCHEGRYFVSSCVWVVGACQVASAWISGLEVFPKNIAL